MAARRESDPKLMKNRMTAERKSDRELVVMRTFNAPVRTIGRASRHARRKRRMGMSRRFAMTAAQPVAPASLRVQLT